MHLNFRRRHLQRMQKMPALQHFLLLLLVAREVVAQSTRKATRAKTLLRGLRVVRFGNEKIFMINAVEGFHEERQSGFEPESWMADSDWIATAEISLSGSEGSPPPKREVDLLLTMRRIVQQQIG